MRMLIALVSTLVFVSIGDAQLLRRNSVNVNVVNGGASSVVAVQQRGFLRQNTNVVVNTGGAVTQQLLVGRNTLQLQQLNTFSYPANLQANIRYRHQGQALLLTPPIVSAPLVQQYQVQPVQTQQYLIQPPQQLQVQPQQQYQVQPDPQPQRVQPAPQQLQQSQTIVTPQCVQVQPQTIVTQPQLLVTPQCAQTLVQQPQYLQRQFLTTPRVQYLQATSYSTLASRQFIVANRGVNVFVRAGGQRITVRHH